VRIDQYTWYTSSRHELVQVSTKGLGDLGLDRVTEVGQRYPVRECSLRSACSPKAKET